MTFVSFAQNAEDLMLWRALGRVERGFWIDVGAADPSELSVTRAFSDRGWRGVNIEPSAPHFERLRAARPRDINLRVALGAAEGSRPFHLVPGTDLATLDEAIAERHRRDGFTVETTSIEVRTLAAICRWHSPAPIHFLKIDVEGAEAEVLAGADFGRDRPWIVLVEATLPLSREESHAAWEGRLLDAEYVFVWFDGLNRFYVAREHEAALAPAFRLPPNHFDDYVRAADEERRVRLAHLTEELDQARREAARAARERDAQAAQIAASLSRRDEALREQAASEAEAAWLRRSVQALRQTLAERPTEPVPPEPISIEPVPEMEPVDPPEEAPAQVPVEAPPSLAPLPGRRLAVAAARPAWRVLRPVVRPIAWRARTFLTAELRADMRALLDRPVPQFEPLPGPEAATEPVPEAPALRPGSSALDLPAPRPTIALQATRRTVHQFHPSIGEGDAITNGMFLLRGLLQRLGFESDIFVEHRDPAFADRARMIDELPLHADYVLMVHHSLGYDGTERIAALPAPKVLVYHNITPPGLLDDPFVRSMAELGRAQLGFWRDRAAAAIADSAFNALELHRAGFSTARACQTLFDPEALRARARACAVGRKEGAPLTILFVGRILPSKGQADLVEAYAAFSRRFDRPSRLVLVGRTYGGADAYEAEIRRRIARQALETEIVLTGGVDDGTLQAWFARADIYASMSRHEGFGVPLVEAMAHGLPIVAVAAGAVEFTVGDAGVLLDTVDPHVMADALLALAADPGRGEAMSEARERQLARFAISAQIPPLLETLALAGAARPFEHHAEAIARALHVTVAGHVNGSYSLAAVNRGFALALDEVIPRRVALLPLENGTRVALGQVPHAEWDRLESLAARTPPPGSVSVLISQHYPIWVPDRAADLAVALFAWEEDLVPAETIERLDEAFDAVLAPSRFVARSLRDSGLRRPVRVVGHALSLDVLARLEHRAGDVFTFLHVSSGFPRKGVDVLLAAFARAFGAGERVRLIVKTFPNPHNETARQIAETRALYPDIAEIVHIDADLPTDELLALYASADAAVLPSRGEGFNIPAAEAMAAGVPLIVSARGGHRDFIGPGDAILIDGRHVPSRSHVAASGGLWFEPDVDALIAAMRHTADEPEPARAVALRVRPSVLRRLDRQAVARNLVDTLADLLGHAAAPSAPRTVVITSWGIRCGIAEYSALLLSGLSQTPRPLILADARAEGWADPSVHIAWEIGGRFRAPALAAAIAREDPQIVLIQHQPGLIDWCDLPALLADERVRERTIAITLHNTRDLDLIDEAVRTGLLVALGSVARIIVHGAADLDRMLAWGLDNAVRIPHGAIPADPNCRPPTRPLLEGDSPMIGTYGFLLPPKGFGALIEALRIVRRTWPEAKLRMVTAIYDEGTSEIEHHALLDLADRIGVGGEVDWHTGFLPRETSLELLRGCDLLVLPYRPTREAASGALHTALASLVPTAATPVEIFDEADDAVARLPGVDPDAMAQGIITLLQDQERRRRLVERQEAWLSQRSWERIAARTFGMLKGLHADRRGPA